MTFTPAHNAAQDQIAPMPPAFIEILRRITEGTPIAASDDDLRAQLQTTQEEHSEQAAKRMPEAAPVEAPAPRPARTMSEDAMRFLDAVFGDMAGMCWVTHFTEHPFAAQEIVDKAQAQKLQARMWGGCLLHQRINRLAKATNANQYVAISIFGKHDWIDRYEEKQHSEKRRKEHFKQMRAVMVDDIGDNQKVPRERIKLPLTAEVETSPDNRQGWYALDPNDPDTRDRELCETLIDQMVAAGLTKDGTDPGMKGVTRYGRLPAGINNKPGRPVWEVKLRELHIERVYTVRQIADAYGLDLTVTRDEKRQRNGNGNGTHAAADSLVPRLDAAGLNPTPQGNGEKFDITCPWLADHTDEVDTGTAYMLPSDINNHAGGFKCHHGHCIDRHVGDLFRWLDAHEHAKTTETFRKMPQGGPESGAGEAKATPKASDGPELEKNAPEAAYPEPLDLWVQGGTPALPRGLLPKVFDDLASHAHEIGGFDAGYVGMAAMTFAAAAIPNNCVVQPKRTDPTWIEPAILWTMLYGPPSVKKSPVLRMLSAILRRINAEHAKAHKAAMAEYLQRKKAAGKDPEAIAALGEPPAPKQAVVTDFTVEALSEVLKDEINSDGRTLVAMDEGALFITPSAYGNGNGSDIPVKLKLYAGDPEWILRIKRGRVYVLCWGTSFLGCSTPEAIIQVIKRMPNNGLLQRVLWLEGTAGAGSNTTPFDEQHLKDYESVIERLHKLLTDKEIRYYFNTEAQAAVHEIFDSFRRLQRLVQFDEPRYAEQIGKWEGLFARLCLVSHIVYQAPGDIAIGTVQRIHRLFTEYLMPQIARFHALTGGRSEQDMSTTTAGRVAQAASAILRMGHTTATTTSLHRALNFWRHTSFMDKLDILATLVGAGWLMPAQEQEGDRIVTLDMSRARMTGWLYHVNPKIHDGRFADRKGELQAAIDAIVASKRGGLKPPSD